MKNANTAAATVPQIKKNKLTRYSFTEDWGEFSRVSEYSILDTKAKERPIVKSSKSAAELFLTEYPPNSLQTKEYCFAMYLTNASKVISIARISEGVETGTVVSVPEVLRRALLAGAMAIILCHNHPSGAKRPSDRDRSLTENIKQGADIIGIKLLDHVILTPSEEEYFSFADENLI